MKSYKLFGLGIPAYLLIISGVMASLLISGVVFAYVDILNQHDYGYMMIGEAKSVTILNAQNGTLAQGALNISTVCSGVQAINAMLSYQDPSGVTRTQPLILNGNTSFLYDLIGGVNLTVNAVQAGKFNCTLDFINDTVTFISFLDGLV